MLGRIHHWPTLAASVSEFIASEDNPPFGLADLEAAAVEQTMSSFDGGSASRDLWRATRLNATKESSVDPLLLGTQEVYVRNFQRAA